MIDSDILQQLYFQVDKDVMFYVWFMNEYFFIVGDLFGIQILEVGFYDIF